MKWTVRKSRVSGEIRVPGDKSIGHRALILAALADGTSRIRNLPDGADILSTLGCVRQLGVEVVTEPGVVRINAKKGLRYPAEVLDAGNSGTTSRLLSGVLAGQNFTTVIDGDSSLRRRPMKRIIDPLELMGASVLSDDGCLPLTIEGRQLSGIEYRLPVASAQVKSCVLLAAIQAQGLTKVIEDRPSRDHTERMLESTGVVVRRNGTSIVLEGPQRPGTIDITLPGDVSSAAFFVAAAVISGGSIVVRECGVNPTRTGALTTLRHMGVVITEADRKDVAGEPVADVIAEAGSLQPLRIEAEHVPLLVDEIPLLALVATQAAGISTIRGAGELRVKECDRIAAVTDGLSSMGANIQALDDGFVIEGPTPLRGAAVHSYGDHRIAMMLAVAGCIADGETTVEGADAASVSYPSFSEDLRQVGALLDAA